MLSDEYEIAVRNSLYERISVIDFIDSFECSESFLDLGAWVLRAPFTEDVRKLIATPGSGITIRRAGQIVFSGPMVGWERSVDGGEDLVTVEGFDDMAVLAFRVVHPEPLTALPSTSVDPLPQVTYTNSHDSHFGRISTIIYNFIDRNAGPGALAARRWPRLSMAPDPLTGSLIASGNAISGRFQNLLEHVAKIAIAQNMTVLVQQVSEGLEVVIRICRNRTNIEISPQSEMVQSWTMRSAAPTSTAAWAGGTGQGTDRTMVYDEQPPPSAWPQRIETFLDQRNVEGLHELERRIAEEFAKSAASTSLELVAADALTSQYSVDFGLGDIVTLRLDETITQEKVTSTSLHIDSQGAATRTFRIGPEDYSGPDRLFDRVRRLGAQVNNSGAT